jgi:hypothetical protein
MKLFLIGIFVTTLSFAGELKTSFSESAQGLNFNLYELSTPGENNRLWDFINSLYLGTEMNGMSISREFISADQNFTFKCVQTYATKGVNEAVCFGKLVKTTYPTAMGTMFEGTPKFMSIILREKRAENFAAILTKMNGVISINLKDKFTITGSDLYVEMQVKE